MEPSDCDSYASTSTTISTFYFLPFHATTTAGAVTVQTPIVIHYYLYYHRHHMHTTAGAVAALLALCSDSTFITTSIATTISATVVTTMTATPIAASVTVSTVFHFYFCPTSTIFHQIMKVISKIQTPPTNKKKKGTLK